ncbi:hypothetical protein Tco_0921514 [Tanacetum coccineum]
MVNFQLHYISYPEEISKISKVKAQVSEVKGVMMENIVKALILSGRHNVKSHGLRLELNMSWNHLLLLASFQIASLEYPLPVKSRNPTEEPVQGIKSNTYLDRMYIHYICNGTEVQ